MTYTDFDLVFTSFLDIERLVFDFEAGILPKDRWTHHAHLIVGTWYIARHEDSIAIDRIRRGIRRHNAAVGTLDTPTSGYHETITLAWAKLIRQYLIVNNIVDIRSLSLYRGVVAEFCDPGYLFRFYEKALLMSPAARATWVEPDKLALPSIDD